MSRTMASIKLFMIIVIFMTVSFLAVALKFQTAVFFRLPAAVRMVMSVLHAGIVVINISLYVTLCVVDYGSLDLPAALRVAGVAVAVPGLFLILAGVLTLKAALFFPSGQDRLITSRFYLLVRNPMYLGGITGSLGIALATASRYSLYYTGIFAIVLYTVSRLEERDLAGRFGREFETYRRQVPRLMPTPASISAFVRSFRREARR